MKQPEWMPDEMANSLNSCDMWGCVMVFGEVETMVGFVAKKKSDVVRMWNMHMMPFCGYGWEQARRKKRAKIIRVVVSRKDGGYTKG